MTRTVARSCTVAVVAALVIAVVPAVAGARDCSGLGWRDRTGPWTRIQAPMTIRSFTVDSYDPSVMFVANDKAVMRSVNTGCSWEGVFSVDPPREIVDIVVAPIRTKAPLYALLSAAPVGSSFVGWFTRPLPGPAIASSRNKGKTWQEWDEGLPDAGRAVALAIAPSDPKRLYLVVSVGQYVIVAQAGQEVAVERSALYTSTDGGKTWSVVADPMFSERATVFGLAVDPVSPRVLWVATSDGLAHSRDGGASWRLIEAVGTGGIDAVDVARRRGRPGRITAFRGGTMFLSPDGGRKWEKFPARNFYDVRAAAHVPGSMSPIVSAETQMFRFDMRARRWKDVTPKLKAERARTQDTYLCRFSMTRGSRPALYSCTSTTLLRYGAK